MTKTTYTAFGAIRTSETAYTCASMDSGGTVRFHETLAAARRFANGSRITDVRVLDAAEAKAIKAAEKAKRDRRNADRETVMECAMAGGDWRALRAELAAARGDEVEA